jgi:hypothetical protein
MHKAPGSFPSTEKARGGGRREREGGEKRKEGRKKKKGRKKKERRQATFLFHSPSIIVLPLKRL